MASPLRFDPSSSRRFLAALTVCTLACGPKLDNDDGGDDSSGSGGTTTTGEAVTSSDSDPTSPGTSPNPTTASTSGGGSDTATTASTTASTTGVVTSGDPTATATATSTVTSDSDEPPPVDPPVPCAGPAVPLTGVEAQAFLKSQIPPDPNPSGTSGSSGGGEPDPATLYVRLSDQKATCSDPQGTLECGGHWSVLIGIPPEFQAPGLFNLLGQDVSAGASESGPDEGNNECAFGGGTFAATFEIVAIDDTSIEGRLCNVDDFFTFTDPQLEGSFVAPRCP